MNFSSQLPGLDLSISYSGGFYLFNSCFAVIAASDLYPESHTVRPLNYLPLVHRPPLGVATRPVLPAVPLWRAVRDVGQLGPLVGGGPLAAVASHSARKTKDKDAISYIEGSHKEVFRDLAEKEEASASACEDCGRRGTSPRRR